MNVEGRKLKVEKEVGFSWEVLIIIRLEEEMMAAKPSNACILEELKNGVAKFELVSTTPVTPLFATTSTSFFARIAPLEASPALKKVESFRVHKVTGDGRCMFRALVKGMALNKSVTLSAREERENADELRMAIKEVLCDNHKERHQYEEALIAITVEESLKRYCQRIGRADFWGGESELLVLSKLCRQPIMVYIPEHEHTKAGYGSGFIPIAEYGADFSKASGKGKAKKAVVKDFVARLWDNAKHLEFLRCLHGLEYVEGDDTCARSVGNHNPENLVLATVANLPASNDIRFFTMI